MDKQILVTIKNDEYLVEAENLIISENNIGGTIEFDDVRILKNGEEFTEFGSKFLGISIDTKLH